MAGDRGPEELPFADGGGGICIAGGKKAARAGSSLKRRSPDEVRVVRASGNEINFGEEIVMTNISVNRVENNGGMSYATLIPVRHGQIGGKNLYVCNAKDVYLCVGAARRFTTWIAGRIEEYGFTEGHDFFVTKVSPRSGKNSAGGRPSLEYTISSNMAKELAMVERTEKGRAIRNYFIACEEALHQAAPAQAADLLRKALNPEQQHQLSAKVHSKVACLDKARQRAGYAELWSELKARHQVAQYRDIPQGEFEEACQFVEAYIWEGSYLPKQGGIQITGSPRARYLVSFDYKGEQCVRAIPDDACVMTCGEMLRALVTPSGLMATTEELFDFVAAATALLKWRSQAQARRVAA